MKPPKSIYQEKKIKIKIHKKPCNRPDDQDFPRELVKINPWKKSICNVPNQRDSFSKLQV